MHDNPQRAFDALDTSTFAGDHALPGHLVIEFEGPDAVAFAHAQTMNDVAALADGSWQWNGWLTPKGRVLALFALLRFSADRVWLLVADADSQALVASLGRFVFRSKVRIGVRGDLCVRGAFAQPTLARSALIGLSEGTYELDAGGEGGPRTVRISMTDPAAKQDPARQHTEARNVEGFERAWTAFDLAHGWPRLAGDQLEAWTPQQLSLDRLNAYSVKKGCYPGQEIVARTHFLGKAKRGLMLVEGTQGLAAGTTLHTSESMSALGTLVSAIHTSADRSLALAVVPLERDASNLNVGGTAVREIALQSGLGR